MLRREQHPLAEFLDRFRDFVERVGELLDVFAFQRRDKGRIDRRADLFGDLLVFPPGMSEVIQHDWLIESFAQPDQRLHARMRFGRAGLQQRKKLILFPEQSLK